MKIKGNKNEGLRFARSAWLPKKEKAHDREAEGFDYLKGANSKVMDLEITGTAKQPSGFLTTVSEFF